MCMNMNHHNYYMELVNDRDYGKKYDICVHGRQKVLVV